MLIKRQNSVVGVLELLERREMFAATPLVSPETVVPPNASAIVMPAALLHAAVATDGTGLTATYFSDPGFSSGKLIRTDATVNLKASAKDKITQ